MAQPITVGVTGAITTAPASPTGPTPLYQTVKTFGLQRTYAYRTDHNLSINNPATPYSVPLGSISKVRFMALTVVGSSVELRVTWSSGVDQTSKVSEFLMFSSPSEGDQLTAIKLVGVSDIELILMGD